MHDFFVGANGIAASQRGGEPECCAEDGLGVETAGDQLWDQGEAGHRRPPRAHGAGQRRLRPAGFLKSQFSPKPPVQSSSLDIFLQLICILLCLLFSTRKSSCVHLISIQMCKSIVNIFY